MKVRQQRLKGRDYHEFTDYEVNRTETSVLFTPQRMTVEFTIKTVSFNAMRALDESNDSKYIHILMNSSRKEMRVAPSERDTRDALRWKNEDGEPLAIPAACFCAKLYTLMGWNKEYMYKVCGNTVTAQGTKQLLFKLDTSEAYPIKAEPAVNVEFVIESGAKGGAL